MATNETARAAAFASQSDRSRELTAGYVDQMIALSRAVRDMRDGTIAAIGSMQIPHRWNGTRLDLLVDGIWLAGPDLAGKDARGVKSVDLVDGRLVLTYDDDETVDLGPGTGDVVGPADGVEDGSLAVFDGITGRQIKGAGKSPSDFATAVQGAKADSAVQPEDLASVAASGAYSDLSGTPSLFSGEYNDLSGKPTIGTAAAASVSDFATAVQGAKADSAVQPEYLGTAAAASVSDFATAVQGALADTAVQPEYLGTSASKNVGTSAGDVVQLDGSARLPAVDGSQLLNLSGGQAGSQVFTTSGTFTKPEGISGLYVECIGGGGAGSGSGAAGGGGGGFLDKFIPADEVGATVTVTIGAGGAVVTSAAGGSGGDSSFGSHVVAKGGKGGGTDGAKVGGDGGGGERGNSAITVPAMSGWGSGAGGAGGEGGALTPGVGCAGGNSTKGGGGGGGGASSSAGIGGSSVTAGYGGRGGYSTAGFTAGVAGSAPGGGGGGTYSSGAGAGARGEVRVYWW